jgi:uncharacterized membrane protein (DUF485 family)
MHAVLEKRENLTTHLTVLLALLYIIFVIKRGFFVSSLLFIPENVAVKISVFHFDNEI